MRNATSTTYKLRKLGSTYPGIVYAALAAFAQHTPIQAQLPGNLRLTKAVHVVPMYSNMQYIYLHAYAKVGGSYRRYKVSVWFANGSATQGNVSNVRVQYYL